MSYGHCVEVTLHRTHCQLLLREASACKLVSLTQGVHRKEKEYLINKGFLKVLLCVLCDSDSVLEILY